MQLEAYFDFLAPNDIRLKGTRIGIETILYDFLHRSCTPDEIQQSYPSLSLEQVYATLTYYYHQQEAMIDYLTQWLEHGKLMRAEQQRNPLPVSLRLQKIKAELVAAQQTNPELDVPTKLQELKAKYQQSDTPYVAA